MKKVHTITKFKQKRWLEPHIRSTAYFKTIAENSFEKDTYKLASDSVFGKTIQSEKKEGDLHIVTNENMRNKHASSIYLDKK